MVRTMSLFPRITATGKPDALRKYGSVYKDKLPTDCATIDEARELVALLAVEAPKYRKGGLGLPQPQIIANGGGMGQTYFDVEEMVAEGFPTNLPCHLQLKYLIGTKTEMIEVFDAAYQIGSYGAAGYRNIINDLERNA
jgi:hypothetical protein